jgi:hypothetical protein
MAKTKNQKGKETYEEYTPFIEHPLSKSLRRVLKYTFRSVTIASVLLFSTIALCAISFILHLTYCYLNDIPFQLTIFEVWMVVEAMFLIGMNLKYKVFKNMDSHHLPKVTRVEFQKIYNEFNNIADIQKFFEGWFFGTSFRNITAEDLYEWISAKLFNSRPEYLDTDQTKMALKLLENIKRKVPYPIKDRQPG